MADTIVTVNIYAKTANTDNGWVPAPVAKQSPVLNYDADLDTTLSLLNFPNVFIYDAGTGQAINKSNLQTYYPEYNPGGGGGGGTTNYTDLTNKPKINNVTLQGNKSLSDIGAPSVDEVYKKSEVDTALDNKVTKESGKGLSTNDFTNDALSKLSGIEPDAEANVQSDWNQTDTDSDDFIKNKPTLATVATSGDYNDLSNKPTIPDAQVNSDWNSESGVSQILNKPALGAAAAKGVDSAPTASSTNLVESGGVEAALAAKLNTADVDDALSGTSTNPVQNKAVQALVARLVDAGAKNLIRFTVTAIDDMPTGLTATVNEDMSITVNGMASGSDFIYKKIGIFVYRGGVKYKMPVDYPADLYFYTNDNRFDSRTGQSYTYAADGRVSVWFRCKAGVQYDNVTIHPMLCTAEDYAISPDFVPYAKSNYELTQAVEPIPRLVDAGAKNVADMSETSFTSQTKGGVTVTLSGDTFTSSGTSTSDANNFFNVFYVGMSTVMIPPGRWVAMLDGTGIENFRVEEFDSYNGTALKGEFGEPFHFEIHAGVTVSYLRITTKPGTLCDGNFRLMICKEEDYAISPEFVPYAPSNRELYETKADKSQVVGAGTKLATNADLNSVTTLGLYYTDTQALTNSLSNCPVTNTLLVLKVSFGTSTILQELQPVGNAQVANRYVRTYGSGAWTYWYKFEGTAVT